MTAPTISRSRATAIAEADALPMYGVSLHTMESRISLHEDGWHIDYELRDQEEQGGGPHYVIDASTGAIVSKKYYQ
jgi:hypothetical protein